MSQVCLNSNRIYGNGKGFILENGTFVNQLRIFTEYDWMFNQTFCWSNNQNVKVTERLTKFGICFAFNSKDDLLIEEA
jgi:hypothetical protein